jgi:hypothetical protein
VDQVFSQGDTDLTQPGRGLIEPLGCAAVLGLIFLPAFEFGLGDRSPCLRDLFVEERALLAQQAESLFLGLDGSVSVGPSGRLPHHGLASARRW